MILNLYTIIVWIVIYADLLVRYTLFFNKNVVSPAQAEYSFFSADFRLKIFLYYS